MNNNRQRQHIALIALTGLVLSLGASSCSTRNPTIDRIVDPYWNKSDFNKNWETQPLSNDVWHFRKTITDTGINEGRMGIADGDWLQVDRLRWEITETALVGWRDYVAVPGSSGENFEGGGDVLRGERIVSFPITRHFDRRQSYDPVTGQESNLMVENMEKPWYDRAYFRVDWSRLTAFYSLVPRNSFSVQHNDVADPDRWRFEMNNGYFETTTRQEWPTDIYSYFGYYNPNYAYDGYASVLNIRFSFKKSDANNDYESLHFPDHVVRLDADGNEMRDSNGIAQRMPIFDKFGLYRVNFTGRNNWDQDRGLTNSNKDYNVTRFNIWEKSHNSDGSLIPLHERDVKPIVYYPNVQHAEDILDLSESVVGEWNRAFQEMYFAIHDEAGTGKYDSVDDVDVELVLFSKNSCHVDNVIDVMKSLDSEVRDAVEKASGFQAKEIQSRLTDIWASDSESTFTQQTEAEDQAHLDLERICTALEWYTAQDDSPFRYQRPGDLRYNMINLVVKRAETGWLGLGPMLADPLSGETLQAVSNINMAYLDSSSATAARQMGVQLGETAFNDMIRGSDIRLYNRENFAKVSTIAQGEPTGHLMGEMDQRIENLREAGQLLQEVTPGADQARRSRLAGTRLEDRIISPDDVTLFGGVQPGLNDQDADLDELILDKVSPFREGNLWEDLKAEEQRLAQEAMMPFDGPGFVDQLTLGVSVKYRDMSYKERFRAIRRATFRAVLLHEMGHNMGLGHNMAGSGDPLNYGPRFWAVQALPEDLADAATDPSLSAEDQAQLQACYDEMDGDSPTDLINLHEGFTMTAQDCLRQQEGMYSSIMDYHTSWNSDNNGLGPYDIAAIKFGYAQLVETFPTDNIVASNELKDWLFLNDWRDIPSSFVKDTAAIQNRGHYKYSWNQATTSMTPPVNEVPYKYCLDSSGNYGPECKAWDFGPDFRTRAKWMEIVYYQYYFFSHFARDRLMDWRRGAWRSPVRRDLRMMLNYNQIMKWFYYYKATNPDFTGSYAEQDFLQATTMGLNHYAHVMGHPAAGEYLSVPKYSVESLLWENVDPDDGTKRFTPTDKMIHWDWLGTCTAYDISEVENGRPSSALEGYTLSEARLGDGRPFFAGFTDDYEDWYVTYVGAFYPKSYVAAALSDSSTFFPGTETIPDRRFFHVNWYRLFPDAVGKLMSNIISQNYFEFGPVVDEQGKMHRRDLIDPETGEAPDYSGYKQVYPSVSSYLSYYAMVDAAFGMSYTGDGQTDVIDTMRIALEGSEDDLASFELADPENVVTFTHPVSGMTYRALKVGDHPIAFDMVTRLNQRKERYERLDACVNDEAIMNSDVYCHCVRTSTPAGYCCNSRNDDCPAPYLVVPGGDPADDCSLAGLQERRDSARETMDNTANLIDDLRFFVKIFDNRF